MIAEDVLERGFAAAADDYEVPADGVDRLRELLAPRLAESVDGDGGGDDSRVRFWQRRPSPRGWLALAAASLVLLIAVPLAVGGSGAPGSAPQQASAPAGAGTVSGASGGSNGGSAGSAASTAGKGATLAEHSARVPQKAVAAPVPAPALAGAAPGASAGVAGATTGASAGVTSGAGAPAAPPAPIGTVPQRIVKTGELDLEVAKGQVSPTLNRLTALATLEHGYVASSNTDEVGPDPSGSITLRVPVGAFEDTVSRARGYGTKVLALDTSAQDVTSKYVDLGARINALQRTRDTFLTLLTRANTIGDTLAVQQRISDVQTQIEQLQGQRKVLASRSALSTLTVTVNQKAPIIKGARHHETSAFVQAVDRSVSRFVRGVEAIIGVIGPLLLAVLVIAVCWFGGRIGYRLLRRRLV